MGFLSVIGRGLSFYAQKAPAASSTATQQSGSWFGTWGMLIIIVLMVVVFYFLLIRPQRRRQQEHDSMVQAIGKGDEVVTIGGIHGVVKKVTEDTIMLDVDKNVTLTFSKSAVSRRVSPVEEEEEEEETTAEEPGTEAEEAEETEKE